VNPKEVTTLSLTKNSFVYPPKPSRKSTKSGTKSGQDENKYNVVLTWEGLASLYTHWVSTSSDKVTSRTLPTISLVLEGTSGSTDVKTVDLEKVKQLNGKSISKLEVFGVQIMKQFRFCKRN